MNESNMLAQRRQIAGTVSGSTNKELGEHFTTN